MSVFKENEVDKIEKILKNSFQNHPLSINEEVFEYLGYPFDSILNDNHKNYLIHALKRFKNVGMVSPIPYNTASFSDEKLWYLGDEKVNGLVAYWPFNEGIGRCCYDYSGNGYYGEFINNTTYSKGKSDNYYGSMKIIGIV